MKNRNLTRLAALGISTAMIMSMVACTSQTKEKEAATSVSVQETETQAEPEVVDKANLLTITVKAEDETSSTVNGLDDELCSWTQGGTDAATLDGDDYSFTPVVYVEGGIYQADKSIAGENEAVTDAEMSGVDIEIEKRAVNGIVIKDSDYTIKDSVIDVNTPDADGSDTCDFSGIGSAIAVYGDSHLTIQDTEIKADGVADLAVFADKGSSALLDNVNLHSDGGTLYEDYINSPNQGTMVAPPWILGIMGNSRGTNLMGDDSTMSVIDSDVSASNWAVLSTDSGSNMYLNVVNTDMVLTGSDEPFQADGTFDATNPYTDKSGYGTYIIGAAKETFIGTTMEVGTYGSIFTGGTGYYGNMKNGETYDLLAADGSTHYSYTATEDKDTVINSDTFGFMAHQGDNECTIDGATVNSKYTDFLIKSGNNTTINIENDAKINAENGILLQLMDNDDSTTEFNPNDEKVGMAFGTSHLENAGFPTEAVDVDAEASETDKMAEELAASGNLGDGAPEGEAAPEGEGGPGAGGPPQEDPGPNQSVYNVTDTALVGSIYNGIGWNANDLSQGKIKQMMLDVNLNGSASLEGAIASTSCIHTSYEGQNYLKDNGITAFDKEDEAKAFADEYQLTSFVIGEYFNIGQVANLVKSNGLNDINVTLADKAVWTVSDTSLIKSLKISGDAQVIVKDGVTLTVDGQEYQTGTYTAADFQ